LVLFELAIAAFLKEFSSHPRRLSCMFSSINFTSFFEVNDLKSLISSSGFWISKEYDCAKYIQLLRSSIRNSIPVNNLSSNNMKIKQHHLVNGDWDEIPSDISSSQCQLVLVFGASEAIVEPEMYPLLKQMYPVADILFASTAGEIMNETVYEGTVVATAIEFEKTKIRCVETNISSHKSSFDTGEYLMNKLSEGDLNNVFVISDGMFINGSELVDGFNFNNTNKIPVTGGLAGDDSRFEKTFVAINKTPAQGNVVAIGLYGENIKVGHSSLGGWDEFGHERLITKADKNVLYEIDGRNALDLYKEYLGDYVDELPGSALLFPLSIKLNGSVHNLVRTILSIDEQKGTMTFAGNMPEGSKVRLMKANFDKLISASAKAAENSLVEHSPCQPTLAILISCVGRKQILQERIDEEVRAAKKVLGDDTKIAGFYSYGEISPLHTGSQCELHNQTMTITTLTEV
jgi:hypothetical protein